MELKTGTILDGKVTGITNFGAFVALPDGKSGMVHISEISDSFVNDIHEYLTVGQELRVRVLSIAEDGKIRLSARNTSGEARPAARQAQMRPSAPASRPAAPAPRPRSAEQYAVTEDSGNREFEDRLKAFMQDSNSKMSGNRLFEQQKKSRPRKR